MPDAADFQTFLLCEPSTTSAHNVIKRLKSLRVAASSKCSLRWEHGGTAGPEATVMQHPGKGGWGRVGDGCMNGILCSTNTLWSAGHKLILRGLAGWVVNQISPGSPQPSLLPSQLPSGLCAGCGAGAMLSVGPAPGALPAGGSLTVADGRSVPAWICSSRHTGTPRGDQPCAKHLSPHSNSRAPCPQLPFPAPPAVPAPGHTRKAATRPVGERAHFHGHLPYATPLWASLRTVRPQCHANGIHSTWRIRQREPALPLLLMSGQGC